MQSTDEQKYNFPAPKFYDFLNPAPRESLESWFCEENISGPSFPSTSESHKKKRRLLRMKKFSTTSADLKQKQQPRAPQPQQQQSNVFDRLARTSTISSYQKRFDKGTQPVPSNATSKLPKGRIYDTYSVPEKGKHRELEGLSHAKSVKERIAHLQDSVHQSASSKFSFQSKDMVADISRSANAASKYSVSKLPSSKVSSGFENDKAVIKRKDTVTTSKVMQPPYLLESPSTSRVPFARKQAPHLDNLPHSPSLQQSRVDLLTAKSLSEKHASVMAFSPRLSLSDTRHEPAVQSLSQPGETHESSAVTDKAIDDDEEEETTLQLENKWMIYQQCLKEKRDSFHKQQTEPEEETNQSRTSSSLYQPAGKRKREDLMVLVPSTLDDRAGSKNSEKRESFTQTMTNKQRRLSLTRELPGKRRSIFNAIDIDYTSKEPDREKGLTADYESPKQTEQPFRRKSALGTTLKDESKAEPATPSEEQVMTNLPLVRIDSHTEADEDAEVKRIADSLKQLEEQKMQLVRQLEEKQRRSSISHTMISRSPRLTANALMDRPWSNELVERKGNESELLEPYERTKTTAASNNLSNQRRLFTAHRYNTKQSESVREPSVNYSTETAREIAPFKRPVADWKRPKESIFGRQLMLDINDVEESEYQATKQPRTMSSEMPDELKAWRQSLLPETHNSPNAKRATTSYAEFEKVRAEEPELNPSYQMPAKYQQLQNTRSEVEQVPTTASLTKPRRRSQVDTRPSFVTQLYSDSITEHKQQHKQELKDKLTDFGYSRLRSEDVKEQPLERSSRPHSQHNDPAPRLQTSHRFRTMNDALRGRFSRSNKGADEHDEDNTQVEAKKKAIQNEDTVLSVTDIDNTNFLKTSESIVESLKSSYHTARTKLEETLNQQEEVNKAREEQKQRQEQQKLSSQPMLPKPNVFATTRASSVLEKRKRDEPELLSVTDVDELIMKARRVVEESKRRREEWKRRHSIKLLDYEDFKSREATEVKSTDTTPLERKQVPNYGANKEKWKISTAALLKYRTENSSAAAPASAPAPYLPFTPTIPKSPSFHGK